MAVHPGNTDRGFPFPIHESGKAWVVERGNLNLFLVENRDGEPLGPRRHVLRLVEGEAVFGMAAPCSSPLRLIAVAAAESNVSELPQAFLDTSARNNGQKCAWYLENWISNISKAAIEKRLTQPFDILAPGGTIQMRESRTLSSPDRVLWIHLVEGRIWLLGDYLFTAENSQPWFPLSASMWLVAEKGSRVVIRETSEVLDAALAFPGLHLFHAFVMESLIQKLEQTEQKEAERLQRKTGVAEAQLDMTFRLLASPMQQKDESPGQEVIENDPWLIACRAVGKEIGIDFQVPSEFSRGVWSADPVEAIARASGVRVRQVALKGDWWKQDNGPLLAISADRKNPIALLPSSRRRYLMLDPVARSNRAVNKKCSETVGPFAWHFYRPFPRKKLNVIDLLRFGLRGIRKDLMAIALMGLGAGLLGVVAPFATGIIFDSIIPGADRLQLLEVFLLVLVAALCTSCFLITQRFAMLRLEGKMDASIQAAVWDRLMGLPVPFFRGFTSGDLATRSLSINSIGRVLTDSVLASLLAGIFSIFSFVLLFYYSWKLALLASVLTLATFLMTAFAGYLDVRYLRQTSQIQGRLSGMLLQFINGISKLRVSGSEVRAFAAWARHFSRQRGAALQARKVRITLAVFTAAFPVLSSAIVFGAISAMAIRSEAGAFSIGDFLAFNAAFIQFQVAVLSLSSAFVSVLGIIPLYERSEPILQNLPETQRGGTYPGRLSGDIEVKHLSFRYRPDAPLVLKDVCLRMPAGKLVAIVGPSGSGKSTLLRLLLGFETPESGAIYFDNQDLAHLDILAVRRQMGVVLQNGRLLSDSIFKNIIGSAPLTMEDAWEAARRAGFEEDLKAMPMGLHTVISEGGGGISGGQRQRLMIARAVVKNPRILLLDEATSALDNETQRIVSRSLESLQATRVVIAHRLSTIVNADYIYVIDKGIVIEEGTYRELIQKDGPFAGLARRQIT